MAAALIKEIPPISIFSIISSSLALDKTVCSNGYKSTINKSIKGISCDETSFKFSLEFLLANIPPNIFGCKVLTLPSKIDGYPVKFSTASTS